MSTTRTVLRTTVLTLGIALGTSITAAPASAAPPSGGPDGRASCVGQVFVPQATGRPRQIADRIHEIMEVELPKYDDTFGDAISGLAGDTWCRSR